jgi:hypothetical protein
VEKRTYEDWNRIGFHVIKGQHAQERNAQGVPIFSAAQVAKTIRRGYGCPAEMGELAEAGIDDTMQWGSDFWD